MPSPLRAHVSLEDANHEILERYKKEGGYRSLDQALNAMIKEHEKK